MGFLINQSFDSPFGAAKVVFALKEFLKSEGWTVLYSGDGVGAFSNSDVITGPGPGAGGLSNTKAWFILAKGAGLIMQFQRGTDSTRWRIEYGNNAGSLTVQNVPDTTTATEMTANGMFILLGGGSAASPVFEVWLAVDGNSRVWNFITTNTTTGHFWTAGWIRYPSVGPDAAQVEAGLVLDELQPTTYPASPDPGTNFDTDPTVVYIGCFGDFPFNKETLAGGGPAAHTSRVWGWFGRTQLSAFSGVGQVMYATTYGAQEAAFSGPSAPPVPGSSQNVYTTAPTFQAEWFPILYMSKAVSSFYSKGFGNIRTGMKWQGNQPSGGTGFLGYGVRGFGIGVSADQYRIALHDVSLPWNGTLPLGLQPPPVGPHAFASAVAMRDVFPAPAAAPPPTPIGPFIHKLNLGLEE